MVQSLLYPSNTITNFWENGMFESISLVSYNFIAPKPYVEPTSNLTNPLGLKQGEVEYLASVLSKLKQHGTKLSIEGGEADKDTQEPGASNGYSYPLDDCVQHGTCTYKDQCLWHERQTQEIRKNEAIKDLFSCHKNLGINQIFYGILAAFCVAGVFGLIVFSDDWRTSSVKGALSLIEISKRLSEGKNLVELVWLHTNKYICTLLDKSFFSSEYFNPTVPLRFEFAQCLILDFGDSWVEKCGFASNEEVTLTVSRSAKPTTRIDLFYISCVSERL
ncbi:hypothetical protein O181_022504 [Austropuccinia psidii MF-1]|uniref:Uncharacterized protein n=1 Tax=Austropuccinia psidii MF-1 TaxID=1389203 RepID=A0A9Q3CCQ7_9BASI|nr:hypothetical protein [Austropuccinia psidii MF-1]